MYEFNGTVKRLCETKTFASGFTKRDLVVTEARTGDWPNIVAFTFKQNTLSLLENVKVGDEVKIGFVPSGREWTDPKTNEVKCFNDLTALRLEVTLSPASDTAAAAADASGLAGTTEEEMPF